MIENLVKICEERAFVMAKVRWSCSGDEATRALEKTGRGYNPTFRLTNGPITGVYTAISRVNIPDELRREGDLGLCLVFGIGEVIHFSNPLSQEGR